jgi:hypothetical protein
MKIAQNLLTTTRMQVRYQFLGDLLWPTIPKWIHDGKGVTSGDLRSAVLYEHEARTSLQEY